MNNIIISKNELSMLSSNDATNKLIELFPISNNNYSSVFSLIASKSWKTHDQRKLAKYYLQKMPFAVSTPYEVFASFMNIENLISVIEELLPSNKSDLTLLQYYLIPTLTKNCKSEDDIAAVNNFLNKLKVINASLVQ